VAALAMVLAGNGTPTTLWGRSTQYMQQMQRTRENRRFLPGIALPDLLRCTADLDAATAEAELLVLATPAQFMRTTLQNLRNLHLDGDRLFVNVAKGIEIGSRKRMAEVCVQVLGAVRYAVLSGPSHAEEVAVGVPTAVVAAADSEADAAAVQRAFNNDHFRVYTSDDVTGVELGGALKNVLALAAGVCDGMDMGDNTKAALMTRGTAELARIGVALHGRTETFHGLSGIGDLIVTCISRHSRNRHVGEQLGKGRNLEDILAAMDGKVAEGVPTAASAHSLAVDVGVDAPIITQVHAALYGGKDPRAAVRELMTRSPKPEDIGGKL